MRDGAVLRLSSAAVAPSKVVVEPRGAITVLTLNRPEVRNCIDPETARLIADAIEGFAADEGARVLVVTGAGDRSFCAGADLGAIEEFARPPAATAPLGFSGSEPGKPTIAAVEGYCVGGGVELACWCDIRIAGQGAVFAALNRRVGVPWVDGGTQRLPRIVGLGNALHLIETGERIDAARARSMGLVQEVVRRGGALERAVELAGRIAAYPQASLLADRASTMGGWGRSLREGLALEAEIGGRAAADTEMTRGARGFTDPSRE